MSHSTRDEGTLLISRHGLPMIVKDTREPHEKKRAVYFILLTTLFERIAFYTLMNTLFETLPIHEPFNWNPKNSLIASFIFSGTSYLSTLIFAIISDAKVGIARMIIIGFGLYSIGFTLMTITASGKTFLCSFNQTNNRTATMIGDENCSGVILGILIITGLGAGAIKSNLAVFGADQTHSSNVKSRYFDKYAVVVNTGSLIAFSILPYVQYIVPEGYYYILYLIASISIIISTLIFLMGRKYYLHIRMNETVVVNCFPVIANACQSWYRFKRRRYPISYGEHSDSFSENIMNNSYSENATEQEREETSDTEQEPSTFLHYARVPYGKYHDRIIDDVKSLRKGFYVFGLLISYWFVYSQVDSTFPDQGEKMKGLKDWKFINTWMKLGEPLTIIVGVFILNKFIYKYLEGRSREKIIVGKFIIGMTFAVLAMCLAAIIEYYRQESCPSSNSPSELWIYFQLFQYISMGFSQLFAMIAAYEYAYFAAPFAARSLFMSLHFCSIGIPSLIGVAISMPFTCPKTDTSYVTCMYFLLLAVAQSFFMLVFYFCQKKIHLIKLNRQQLETSQFM